MYEAYYHLDKRPFALTPDSAFLYLSATHRKALSYLIYGLGQREGFIVITGDIGTGKTLVIQTMFEYLESKAIRGVRLAAANVGPEDVLPLVATSLGLSQTVTTKAALLAEIERTLLHRYPNGVLLIVDEAQTFTPEALEELRLLSNMNIQGRALLQISLVGQSDLRDTLDHPRMEQLRQRIIAWHHLEHLSANEVQDYIDSRLKTAGRKDSPILNPDMFPLIHQWSGGIPRKINILMDRLLLFGYLEEKQKFDASDVLKVIDEIDEEFGRHPSSASATDAGKETPRETSGLASKNDHSADEVSISEARIDPQDTLDDDVWSQQISEPESAQVRDRAEALERGIAQLRSSPDENDRLQAEGFIEKPPARPMNIDPTEMKNDAAPRKGWFARLFGR
ncbi:ExeA family protein [Acidihalobacter ferrooxydans]|uniref:AAA+ ATPase domain-containing protein n=1 Tax=Acidihalobacter ferrooxydans TaxID=1765967 RepID=A0A1P8UI24_9GAMM|nr:AAA family ATPase [Acidihalobacter ferrooxydans]APZ43493.1 hypothetical protein BW247_10660 [Acidihalobacter ferrooxydans]